MPPAERRAIGKKLRDTVPHASHGAWRAHASRTDPIAILRAADATRQPDLVPLRYGRMLQTPFTFYRGSAGVMAADLARTPATGIRVQACGDAHLMNFGGFATPERQLIFDVNDLDETLPAPWEWDVKRLVASFVLAARSNGLSDATVAMPRLPAPAATATRCATFSDMDVLEIWYARLDEADFLAMLPKSQKAVLEQADRQGDGAQQRGAGVSEARRGQRRAAPHPRHPSDHLPCRGIPWRQLSGHVPGGAREVSRDAGR